MRTESKQESLQNSLMTYMGESASQTDLKEAFCRDIDAYSFEFEPQNAGLQPRVQQPLAYPPAPVTPGYRSVFFVNFCYLVFIDIFKRREARKL